jgi:hypothetical protein
VSGKKEQHKKATDRLIDLENKHARARRDRRMGQECTPEEKVRRLRLGSLRRYFEHMFGGTTLPDDDAGRECLEELFHIIALGTGDTIQKMIDEAAYAPWMPRSEAEAMARRFASMPRHWHYSDGDKLAKRIGLTDALRTKLNLAGIGASDVDREARLARRKVKDRERKRLQRRAENKKTRAEYVSGSVSGAIKALGISHSTFYRKPKAEREWLIASLGTSPSAELKTSGTSPSTPKGSFIGVEQLVPPERAALSMGQQGRTGFNATARTERHHMAKIIQFTNPERPEGPWARRSFDTQRALAAAAATGADDREVERLMRLVEICAARHPVRYVFDRAA